MNRRLIVTGACILCVLGCARVRVEAPKEAFKVDISMRLDVYQHVSKDINDIENIVSGSPQKPAAASPSSCLQLLVSEAYAQDGLGADVESAALRRRDRKPALAQYEAGGVIGENQSGLIEIRSAAKADSTADALVRDENADRMAIYKAVAQKNGTSLQDVQKLYAKRLQGDAPAGTFIEVNGSWTVK
jgi:uncharacterized protein